jgi:hypothetical protein
MTRYLAERPWLFVVVAFALLVSVWTCFIYVAAKYGPAAAPLDATPASIHAGH